MAAFGGQLRTYGVLVGLPALQTLVRALVVSPPTTRAQLYWTCRLTLVRRHADLPIFDGVFAAAFDEAMLSVTPPARRAPPGRDAADAYAGLDGDPAAEERGAGLPCATLPQIVGDAEDAAAELLVPERRPGDVPGAADTPFELLSEDQLRDLGRWLEAAVRHWPVRRSRRFAPQHGGRRIDLRRTLARARRTGWEPIDLVHVAPVDAPRRVVMLTDVSQSMQAQSTAYLHLMRALVRSGPAEAYAFATDLTRLTVVLRDRSAGVALAAATERVGDRFGGTRIATNLAALLGSYRGSCLRGAVVVIASDGWDSEPPEALAAAMARLRRRAYRVIWANPRASAPGFQPLVATMRAALPYCDVLLPAGTFGALADVVGEICASSTASHGSRAGTARR